jgi:anti-anti-sigma factor
MSFLCSWVRAWFSFGSASPSHSLHQPEARPVPASEVNFSGPRSQAAAAPLAAAAPCPRPKAALVVRITDLDRAVVVSVAGEASADNLQPLEFARARLLARRVPLAVLDCSALTLLSSLAMGMLIGLRRDLGRWQGRLKLACVGARIEEALQVARLFDLFEAHATVEQALAAGGDALPTGAGR